MQDDQVYRSSLMTSFLQELVVAHRLCSLHEARQAEDKVKFTGIFKLEQFVKELTSTLDALPAYSLRCDSGDVFAGVQIHTGNSLTANISAPSAVHVVGSYAQGTCLEGALNVDVNVVLPEGFMTESDIQGYAYFDKRAMYLSAVAAHLKLTGSLTFSNMFITHEPHAPLKPVLVIQPSPATDLAAAGDVIDLTKPSGLLSKASVVVHIVPPLGFASTRKMAPNRNLVKKIEHQTWSDYSSDLSTHLLTTTPLSETTILSSVAPTPDYNQAIIQDLLSTSHSQVYSAILQLNPVLQHVIVAIKVWLKNRGLYLEPIQECLTLYNLATTTEMPCSYMLMNKASAQSYQSVTSKAKGSHKSLEDQLKTLQIPYIYRGHYYGNQATFGFSGHQITAIVLHLFLSQTISGFNNIQYCFDQFLRFTLVHYPDNASCPGIHSFLPEMAAGTAPNQSHANNNMMMMPPVLPPSNDQVALQRLELVRQESLQLTSSGVTPADLFQSFDIVLLDVNFTYNILHTVPLSQWRQLQFHSLFSLKLLYGASVGALLSHNITPDVLSNNFSLILSSCNLGPQTEQQVFAALFIVKLSKHVNFQLAQSNSVDFYTYFKQISQLYLNQMKVLSTTESQSADIQLLPPQHSSSPKGTQFGEQYEALQQQYMALQQQHQTVYHNDTSLLQHDAVYDIALPISYSPYYPMVNHRLAVSRRAGGSNGVMKKSTASKSKGGESTSSVPSLTMDHLHREMIEKSSVDTGLQLLPLFVPSKALPTRVKTLSSVFGVLQSPQDIAADGDLTAVIPWPHAPTTPKSTAIVARIASIATHALNSRVFSLSVNPQINSTMTGFAFRIAVQLHPLESNRSLDKGPHAEQVLQCKAWRAWWGPSKSQVRRFPDGSIIECVLWNLSSLSYPLASEQIPFIILQHIMPLHLFTSGNYLTSASNAADPNFGTSNMCVVSTPTHPLGLLVQSKQDAQLLQPIAPATSAPIVSDPSQSNIAQSLLPPFSGIASNLFAATSAAVVTHGTKLVSQSAPFASELQNAFTTLSHLLQEMRSLPLGVETVTCTHPALRGTTPFPPVPHDFDPKALQKGLGVDPVNHMLDAIDGAFADLSQHNVFEPISVLMTLGSSNKWPKHDLFALSRLKTAFYLKLGGVIKSEYHVPRRVAGFDDASSADIAAMDKKQKKRWKKQQEQRAQMEANSNVGNTVLRCQVTPYYVDIWILGYVFRCRIVVHHEVALFRHTTTSGFVSPVVLGDGIFRHIEKEFLYRPKHHDMIKNIAANFHSYPLVVQHLHRWLSSHHVSRHITVEVCELLVASVFVQSTPYPVPHSVPAAFLRVLHRLATFDFDTTPLIIPNITFTVQTSSATQQEQNKLLQSKNVALALTPITSMQHSLQISYFASEYESDILVDALPSIVSQFVRRTQAGSQSYLYLVTSYDLESRVWTCRPATHAVYQHHLDALTANLGSKVAAQSKQANKKLSAALTFAAVKGRGAVANQSDSGSDSDSDSDDEDTTGIRGLGDDTDSAFVSLQASTIDEESLRDEFKRHYAHLIDRGDSVATYIPNAYPLLTALTQAQVAELQALSLSGFNAFGYLFLLTLNGYGHTPLVKRYLTVVSKSQQIYSHLQSHSTAIYSGSVVNAGPDRNCYLSGSNQPWALWPIKSLVQWTFQQWLGLYKPQFALTNDCFILLSPSYFTTDQLARSLWLFKSKPSTDSDEATHRPDEYSNVYLMSTQKGSAGLALPSRPAATGSRKAASEFKLPADLAKKLEAEESAMLATGVNPETGNLIQYNLFAGFDPIQAYLDQLRGVFGQYATFYSNHIAGHRLIGVKFHSFVTPDVGSDAFTLKTMQRVVDTRVDAIKARLMSATSMERITGGLSSTDIDALLLHPENSQLPFMGIEPRKVQTSVQLVLQKVDLFAQMLAVGGNLIDRGYLDANDLLDDVFF